MRKAKIDEILKPVDETSNRERETRVRTRFWGKLKSVATRIPFAQEITASYYCAMDPATPNRVRAILLAALAYFILPLDGIPDFLLGIGFGDDFAVITAAITAVRGHVNDNHRQAAKAALERIANNGEATDQGQEFKEV